MTCSNNHYIYLDHAATTPIDVEVGASMIPWISDPAYAGNPSSVHSLGRIARAAVDDARDSVAALIGADYSEITFTSSGTEANNLALIGIMTASTTRNHLVTAATEHHAVLHSTEYLKNLGYQVTVLPVDRNGFVSLDMLHEAVTPQTALVSIMHGNNEIGTVQPVAEIAKIAHASGALYHMDAVQTVGMLEVDVKAIGCDLLSLSAHKFYGPKGAAALFARSGLKLNPLLHGGGQERERRAGTENVSGIVGMGVAARLSKKWLEASTHNMMLLRDQMMDTLKRSVEGLSINGPAVNRLPNNINFSVQGIEGSTLLMNLDRVGVLASSGAACSSGSIEPSHVLTAIGLSGAAAAGGVRFSIGRSTTPEEIELAVQHVAQIVDRLRSRSQ